MSAISRIQLSGCKQDKQIARETLGHDYDAFSRMVEIYPKLPILLVTNPLNFLDRKIKHGENLSFEESLVGMSYVLAATNQRFNKVFRQIMLEDAQHEFFEENILA